MYSTAKHLQGNRVTALDKHTVILLYASSTIFSKATKEKNIIPSSNSNSNSNQFSILSP